jgi:Holliday junction DNA helicase RuvA
VPLYTELVIREDAWTLYGFDSVVERAIFQRLLGRTGLGPRLPWPSCRRWAGAGGAEHPGQGRRGAQHGGRHRKKRAEKLIVELSGPVQRPGHLAGAGPRPPGDEAAKALQALGYAPAVADEAVRAVLAEARTDDVAALVRRGPAASHHPHEEDGDDRRF